MSDATKMEALIKVYLDDLFKVSANTELELEVKFGTRGVKPLSRIDYGNVIQHLLSHGFQAKGQTKYLLRIQNEYLEANTGTVRMSSLRTELNGLHNVQAYCKSNKITGGGTADGALAFIKKDSYKHKNQPLYPVNVDDYNFRLALSSENKLPQTANTVRETLDKWPENKKIFRYLNRYTLQHPDFPFVIDFSIVKESKKQGNFYVPEFTLQESGLLAGPEKYEIEVECVNTLVGVGTPFSTPVLLLQALQKVVKYVLAGLQETNYPIPYSEQRLVLYEYMELLWHPQGDSKRLTGKELEKAIQQVRATPKNFVGPSSYTLELQNIMPVSADIEGPNIRANYTVTDKADGDRKLLYITPETGKIYLINTNMAVQFTGAITRNKDLFNTLLDGEHILYNKHKKFINLYTAFDIYALKGENVRGKAFVSTGTGTGTGTGTSTETFRLPLLANVIKRLLPESIVKNKLSATPLPSPLRIEQKTFYAGGADQTIFQGCSLILQKVVDGLFEYHTDGLIFTPALLGVGANKHGEHVKPLSSTWNYSFKWKPVEQNTIDFLISVKKLPNDGDYIGNKFETGLDLGQAAQLLQYKTLILRVGFNENDARHAYMNPCQDIIDDKLPTYAGEHDDEDLYKPVQFFPTQPADPTAGLANILLEQNSDDEKVMLTEAKEVIEDNMIVEFSYDINQDEGWRWKPLRVRYDKTAMFRSGLKNYGNAYHVANSNWHTIHKPITPEMITTGEGLPTDMNGDGEDEDVYYNRKAGKSLTNALRDFHNRYVKKSLLNSVAKRGDTLIDLAVGKGGDFPKWIGANLKFVLGIDISRDNIQNRLDGACVRYLKNKRQMKHTPDALFVVGNSSVNIRSGAALYSEKDKQISRAVFGEGAKDAKVLGKGVYKEYGIAQEGFDICSIQFAIHYMFENQDTLQNFLRNVSEVTKVGGYFIGTSYDGKLMFNLLKGVKEGESVAGTSVAGTSVAGTSTSASTEKLWEVTKRYNRQEFEDNASCLGYAIDVYQESINKIFREYLVNYDYLTQLLENYGFVLLPKSELREKPINNSTGLFTELFTQMTSDLKRNPRLARDFKDAPNMTAAERQISFLNRYFIYKKVRNVDTENVFLGLTKKTASEEKAEEEATKRVEEAVLQAVAVPSPVKVKGKTKKTLKLVEAL
jgi:SAM-dependent methyltransferase